MNIFILNLSKYFFLLLRRKAFIKYLPNFWTNYHSPASPPAQYPVLQIIGIGRKPSPIHIERLVTVATNGILIQGFSRAFINQLCTSYTTDLFLLIAPYVFLRLCQRIHYGYTIECKAPR